jgi:protein-L-isoaspartate(D-aspartate) O-methyltransferase
MTDFQSRRQQMVERQLRARGIRDSALLEAFRAVPRERFVPTALAAEAYGDHPLPIGSGQTISQPYIVALMIEAAGVRPGMRVLEVGAGSGYAAAIIGQMGARVVTVERDSDLAASARARLAALGASNVAVVEGDGSLGWPADSPFDAIIVAAGGPDVPPSLVEQLAAGGTLVMPVGEREGAQQLVRIRKTDAGMIEREVLCDVRFVPLIGAGGWEASA